MRTTIARGPISRICRRTGVLAGALAIALSAIIGLSSLRHSAPAAPQMRQVAVVAHDQAVADVSAVLPVIISATFVSSLDRVDEGEDYVQLATFIHHMDNGQPPQPLTC